MFVIPKANQHSYNSIPRNGDLRLTIDNHCNVPSHTLLVDWKGDCFVCSCEAWLPVTAGNILDVKSLNEFWSTGVPAELQQDINQKKFTHCAVDRCGILNHDIEEKILHKKSELIDLNKKIETLNKDIIIFDDEILWGLLLR